MRQEHCALRADEDGTLAGKIDALLGWQEIRRGMVPLLEASVVPGHDRVAIGIASFGEVEVDLAGVRPGLFFGSPAFGANAGRRAVLDRVDDGVEQMAPHIA